MKLETINWPVFLMKREQPNTVEGITGYLKHQLLIEENELNSSFLVVDDKNIKGDTLGIRRLKLMTEGVTLYKFRRAVYMLGDLIRLSIGKNSWFIDNSGTVFNYIKTVRAPLTCHRIKKILRVHTGGHILELEGLTERFKILNDVQDCKYAGIININKISILYGLYENNFKKSYRLV